MTEPIVLLVVLDLDVGTLAVDNRSNGKTQPTQQIGPLPLSLRLEPDPADANNRARLVATQADPGESPPPFEPWRVTGREVLAVAATISDQALGTQDNTRYLVTIKNVSGHFAAVDISVTPRVDPRCGEVVDLVLPDGHAILEIRPHSQLLRCLRPGDEDLLTYIIHTRGPAPGVYPIQIEIQYRLVYWECRDMRSMSSHPLTITDRCPAKTKPPAIVEGALLRRDGWDMDKSKQNLSPQYQEINLREGGKLAISYSLAKGHNNQRCVCGVGAGGEAESYFQTIDTATLVVKITNKGPLGLRHLYATKIKVMRGDHEMTDPLPDGNLLFENVPRDVYYGDLPSGAVVTKEIELITRGTAPGPYEVTFEFSYAVEGCALNVALAIAVCPD